MSAKWIFAFLTGNWSKQKRGQFHLRLPPISFMTDNRDTAAAAKYRHREERVEEHSKAFKKEYGLTESVLT